MDSSSPAKKSKTDQSHKSTTPFDNHPNPGLDTNTKRPVLMLRPKDAEEICSNGGTFPIAQADIENPDSPHHCLVATVTSPGTIPQLHLLTALALALEPVAPSGRHSMVLQLPTRI